VIIQSHNRILNTRGMLKGVLLFLCWFLVWAGIPSNNNEYDVKAMFVYNFTKYVEWPETSDPVVFRIAVCGNSDIIPVLQSIAQKKSIGTKKIEIVILPPGEIASCQILFVPKSESHLLEELARKCQGKGILIVSEECRNAGKGAAINLVNSNSKIRFDIYLSAARSAGVKISSQLTSLALNVNP